jgi:hypothetical protein
MAGTDLYRGTSGVPLPPVVSNQIWAGDAGAVRDHAGRAADPAARRRACRSRSSPATRSPNWVAETEIKPVSRPTLSNKTITAYTLAVIVPFSNQFRRDAAGLYRASSAGSRSRWRRSSTRPCSASRPGPGSDFDTLGAATEVGIAGKTWAGLVAAQASIATYGRRTAT